jgi:RNA polymerase sigma factor (sigma-70 family)
MYKRRFYAICMRYTHDMAEAEDILQDGFVKIFKSIDRFTRAGSFEGWMKRIIVNTAIEYFRKRTNLYSITEFEYAESVSYNEQTIENIAAGDILKLIQELPIGYRTVFNLYAIEGFSHKEIGDMLEISEGTSKSQLARARGILQQKVNDLFDNEKKNIS